MRLFATFLMGFLLCACAPIMDATSKGPIRQDPGTRTVGSALDDSNIENITLVNIRKIDQKMRRANITVVSYNGVVLLLGQVPTEDLRRRAAEVAADVKRVRQVQNALTVGPNTRASVRMYDSWLTTKIKTKFAFNQQVDSGRIKVVTENGHVYLMGLVRQAEADRAAQVAQRTDGAQRIVKAFEYID